jgi:hypothetical protein
MSEQALCQQLIDFLTKPYAHLTFADAIKEFPVEHRGQTAVSFPHTAWQLLEHLRISQWDIVEFCRDADHVSPEFPDGYWPDSDGPQSEKEWDDSVGHFEKYLNEMVGLVADLSNDLYTPFPHGDGQTLLREAMVLADHNAYHLGQLMQLRKTLAG